MSLLLSSLILRRSRIARVTSDPGPSKNQDNCYLEGHFTASVQPQIGPNPLSPHLPKKLVKIVLIFEASTSVGTAHASMRLIVYLDRDVITGFSKVFIKYSSSVYFDNLWDL